VLLGSERCRPAVIWECGLNRHRAACEIGSRGEIQGVQALKVGGTILRHRDEVNGSIRPGFEIDHRSGSDSDFRSNLAAATHRVAGSLTRWSHRDFPQLSK